MASIPAAIIKIVGAYVPTVAANTVPYNNGLMIVDPSAWSTASPPNSRPASLEEGRRESAREFAVGEEADPKVAKVEKMMNHVSFGFSAKPI